MEVISVKNVEAFIKNKNVLIGSVTELRQEQKENSFDWKYPFEMVKENETEEEQKEREKEKKEHLAKTSRWEALSKITGEKVLCYSPGGAEHLVKLKAMLHG